MLENVQSQWWVIAPGSLCGKFWIIENYLLGKTKKKLLIRHCNHFGILLFIFQWTLLHLSSGGTSYEKCNFFRTYTTLYSNSWNTTLYKLKWPGYYISCWSNPTSPTWATQYQLENHKVSLVSFIESRYKFQICYIILLSVTILKDALFCYYS